MRSQLLDHCYNLDIEYFKLSETIFVSVVGYLLMSSHAF